MRIASCCWKVLLAQASLKPTKTAPKGGAELTLDGPKMAPRWPKMGQRCRKDGFNTAQDGSRWPQDGPKMVPRGPKRPQDGLWRSQDDPKRALTPFPMVFNGFGVHFGVTSGPSWGHLGAILGPSWGLLKPVILILGEKWRFAQDIPDKNDTQKPA